MASTHVSPWLEWWIMVWHVLHPITMRRAQLYAASDRHRLHSAYSTHCDSQSTKHAAQWYIPVRRSTSRSLWLRCSQVTSDFGYPTQGILKKARCLARSENTAPKGFQANSHAFLSLGGEDLISEIWCLISPHKSWLRSDCRCCNTLGKSFH